MTASRIATTAALASTCLAIGTLLGGSLAAWAGTDPTEISACYSNTNGILRILTPDGQCRPDETAIEWNQAGAPGPVGPQGPTGPGLTGIERISDASPLDSADVKTLDVGCPAEKVVLTGGARVAANTFQASATVFLNWSAPLVITGETAPTRWVARAGEATLSDLDWSLVVWVWCVDDPAATPLAPQP